ncbi:hypothetical protein GGX14DRAFT_568479 [Mycena pura]|uniref:Uncharacterized protein n=1 Tax=Mycena pura TaxID=153505 RepID=A0AAD6YER5_9AGAR|nr:hypothetical protein GGX14DRAFT_568479 [Mycena pura]
MSPARTKDKENGTGASKSKQRRSSSSRKAADREKRAVLGNSNSSRRSNAQELDGEITGAAAERIRQLEALLASSEERRVAAEEVIDRAAGPDTANNNTDTIPQPDRLSSVKMTKLKKLTGMSPQRWSSMRMYGRHRLHAGKLNFALPWKKQDTFTLGVVARAITDNFPELQRFTNHWATYHIMKESWDNMKNYGGEKDRTDTYIGRKAAERRGRQLSPSSPRRGTGSPTPRPSCPRSDSMVPSRPTRPTCMLQRVDDTESGGEDDDEDNDDMVMPNGGDGSEDNDGDGDN